MNTSAGAAYGDADYIHRGCGMGEEATLYLTERGVRVVGTDAWSWDAPFLHTARKFAAEKDPSIIWEGHKAGRRWCWRGRRGRAPSRSSPERASSPIMPHDNAAGAAPKNRHETRAVRWGIAVGSVAPP